VRVTSLASDKTRQAWQAALIVCAVAFGVQLTEPLSAAPKPRPQRLPGQGGAQTVQMAEPATGTLLPGDVTPMHPPQEATPVAESAHWIAAVAQSGAAESEQHCVNRNVAAITWQGCEGTHCEHPEQRTLIESLTEMRAGTTIRRGAVARATSRMLQLGFFAKVHVDCQTDTAGGAQLRWTVAGNHFVRRVDFAGNAAVFEDELRAKLVIRPGDILNPDSLDGSHALTLQRTAIEGLYQRYGFDSAKVQIGAVPFDGGRPDELRLVVAIDEGVKQRVAATHFRLEPLAPPSEAEEHAGLVCPKVSERMIREVSELQNVEVFTRRAANKAKNNIRTFLRRLGFSNPTVGIPEPKDNIVDITVRTGRCHLLQIYVREEPGRNDKSGFRLVTTDDDQALYDALPFGESGIFEFEEADRGRTALAGVLENRGYLFADVRLDHRPVPPPIDHQVESAITYYVTTGFVSQIRGIQFPGGEKLDEDQLKSVMTTKAYDMLNTGGFLQIDQLLADLDALRQFYMAAGYFNFGFDVHLPEGVTTTTGYQRNVVVTPEGERYDYLYKDKGFRIRRPKGEDFVYIEIPLNPGRRTHLAELTVDGTHELRERAVRDELGLTTGQVVSFDVLTQAVAQVDRQYKNLGFFRARISAFCTAHAPDRPETACSFEAMRAETVDVRLHVDEGERVEIGEVFIRGNFETADNVILRDMPKSGEPFSAAALFESQRRLRNLGLFGQVTFDYIGDDETPPRQRLGVVVQVAENSFRWMEYAVGVQTINASHAASERTVAPLLDTVGQATAAGDRTTGGYNQGLTLNLPNLLLTGEAAWVNRNFFGWGKQMRIPVKVGLARSPKCGGDTFIACDQQTVLDTLRLLSLTPTYTDSRLFGSDITLNLTAPYFIHDYASGVVDIDRTGALVQLARRFGKVAVAVAFDAGFIRTRTPSQPTTADAFRLEPQFQISPTLTWDHTDSPLNPTRGFFLSTSLQYINAYKQVVSSPTPELIGVYQHGNYVKYEGSAKGYIPIGQVVLAMLVHAGGSSQFGSDSSDLPDWARYQLGGVQGLRGYTDLGVKEYLRDGTTKSLNHDGEVVSSSDSKAERTKQGGNVIVNGSMELRFPILRETGIWGAGFWDWGAIADTASELYPASFRHGVGIGLRWLLSGQIPIRIDYGFAVGASRVREITSNGVQTTKTKDDSPGALSFSVLYSF
jgi:outer membrane protein assembly factor BamA